MMWLDARIISQRKRQGWEGMGATGRFLYGFGARRGIFTQLGIDWRTVNG